MNIILVDGEERNHFLPFVFTRPIGALRIGIWTLAEKWERHCNAHVSHRTSEALSTLFPEQTSSLNYFMDARVIAHADLAEEIKHLPKGSVLEKDGKWIATCTEGSEPHVSGLQQREAVSEVRVLQRNWNIFQWNGWAMEKDFELLERTATSMPIPEGVTLLGDKVFLEEGARIMPSIINSLEGPVYLGKNSLVMEGSMVRGSLALHEGSQLKMGTKIYGPTTIGPHSKIGGEVSNSVVIGYSNKGHDGFMGNSVIGEWCNLGADTNTSNLKNNYSEVSVWNYHLNASEKTGAQFSGLMMGDHAKSGINTMFNTGTVCGVFANVFDGGFPPKHIKDFSWGGGKDAVTFKLEKALEMAERVMERRKVELTPALRDLYTGLHEQLA